jgi:hypothetical protein
MMTSTMAISTSVNPPCCFLMFATITCLVLDGDPQFD